MQSATISLTLPGVLFTLLTLCSIGYALLSMLSMVAFLLTRTRKASTAAALPVSILKPLKGRDPEMYESFRSHCVQEYPEFEIIFGVNSAADEAVPLVEQLQSEYPQRQIRLVVCAKKLGANGKVSSIVQTLEHARYGHVIINDSDIRVPADYLRKVMANFGNGAHGGGRRVGMVTCLYRAVPAGTLWSRLEGLGVAADFIPGALTSRLIEGGVHFGLGSTLAMDREALKAIGGMEPLVDYLADDYELANGMVKAGYRVALAKVVVETFLPAYNFSQYFHHQLRWGRTVRSSRPGGYVGLVVTFGLFWSALLAIAAHAAFWSWWVLGFVVVLRMLVLAFSAGAVLRDGNALRNFWLLPIADLLSPVIWVCSVFGRKIVWRGEEFVLEKGKLRRQG